MITLFRTLTLLTSRRISSCRGTCVHISAFAFPLEQVLCDSQLLLGHLRPQWDGEDNVHVQGGQMVSYP